jgi:hypothetical protein
MNNEKIKYFAQIYEPKSECSFKKNKLKTIGHYLS